MTILCVSRVRMQRLTGRWQPNPCSATRIICGRILLRRMPPRLANCAFLTETAKCSTVALGSQRRCKGVFVTAECGSVPDCGVLIAFRHPWPCPAQRHGRKRTTVGGRDSLQLTILPESCVDAVCRPPRVYAVTNWASLLDSAVYRRRTVEITAENPRPVVHVLAQAATPLSDMA